MLVFQSSLLDLFWKVILKNVRNIPAKHSTVKHFFNKSAGLEHFSGVISKNALDRLLPFFLNFRVMSTITLVIYGLFFLLISYNVHGKIIIKSTSEMVGNVANVEEKGKK